MSNASTNPDFLETYCMDDNVTKIKILGHTGKSIFGALENFARLRDRANLSKIVIINLLVRDEGAESRERRQQIEAARQFIKQLNDKYTWLNIQIRFYSAIPTLRGTIVEFDDNRRCTFFSAYQWNLTRRHPIKTSAVQLANIIDSEDDDNERNWLACLLDNWFDYYWGPGVIHTIAFDFDDTIVDTYKEKIEAWICAIDVTKKNHDNRKYFLPEFTAKYGHSIDKFAYIKQLIDEYTGEEIIDRLLKVETPLTIRNQLEANRAASRANALLPRHITVHQLEAHIAAKLFPNVRQSLESLVGQGYSLAVASLTDEERIEKVLENAGLNYFGTVVGKNEYKNRELMKYLTEKVHLIRKIANLAGVPVSRVLYIGDHHRDEDAAKEVGASFIHARLSQQVEASADPETLFFEDYGELPERVSRVESRLVARDFSPHFSPHQSTHQA